MSLFGPKKRPTNVCPTCNRVSADKHCRSKTCDIYWCQGCLASFAGELTSKALTR